MRKTNEHEMRKLDDAISIAIWNEFTNTRNANKPTYVKTPVGRHEMRKLNAWQKKCDERILIN